MKIALTIAGSDSGGGAGIQADLKTFQQFGVFGTSAVVAITAQNTTGVSDVHAIPAETVRKQIAAVASDLPPDACKTGMLASAALVALVAEAITTHGLPSYVCDPVMVATSGDRLLDADAEHSMTAHLVPLAALVTPNLEEAAILTGRPVDGPAAMEDAGRALVDAGAGAALVKGGHLPDGDIVDVLVGPHGIERFVHPRISTTSTHGTGCTLSAGIAAGLALGHDLRTAVVAGLAYVHRAIAEAPGLGRGHGPLNHFVAATAGTAEP
jgi:hydroxymethylpyrimidine/phosphomethylpyrimidine kinase